MSARISRGLCMEDFSAFKLVTMRAKAQARLRCDDLLDSASIGWMAGSSPAMTKHGSFNVIARSVATKQSIFAVQRNDGLLRFAVANDGLSDMRIISRGVIRPRFAIKFPYPLNQRAQGKPGARCTRGLVCNSVEVGGTRAYRSSGGIRLSLRDGLRLIRGLPGDPDLFVTVIREKRFRELDTNPEASEPHDFAIRSGIARLARRYVHRIPAPRP